MADERFEQRIVSEQVGLIAIGIARENQIHPLCEPLFGGKRDGILRARIGQPTRRFGENPQIAIQLPNREQPHIADHLPARKIHGHPLAIDFK